MRRRQSILKLLALSLLLLGTIAVFAACGDDEATDISGVPELEDGVLKIGSEGAGGVSADLWNAVAQLLRVEVEYEAPTNYGTIVGDLLDKRYDIVWSSDTENTGRQPATKTDGIPYFKAGIGILVQAGNPEGIAEGIAGTFDLCGLAVAAQSGTGQIDRLEARNADACKDNPIDIKAFPDYPTAVQELTLGRVAATLADNPLVADSALNSDGELEVAGESAPYGIVVRKDSAELRAVLEQALQQLIDNGTYADILADWRLDAGSIE